MKRISRRTWLRGAGVALALPFLPSAWPRASFGSEGERPMRLVFWFVPNGVQSAWFTPDLVGAKYDLKDITLPLAPVQSHVSVLSGLANVQAEDPVPGDHARGTGSFLTCVKVKHTAGNDIENGISIDQVAANASAGETLFPSLQFGIQPGGSTGDCTAGYSCAYTRNNAWAGPTTPLPNVTDPLAMFQRMFGVDEGLPPDLQALRTRMRSSVLDRVESDAKSLSNRLGVEDRPKLDQYLTAVREVELRAGSLAGGACASGEAPPSDVSFAQKVDLMNDLMVLALQCDLTRVATFMLGEGGSNQTFDFIGVPGAHHQISHHQNDPKALADLVTIANWEVSKFAEFTAKLVETPDGDGTLIDSTLSMLSSEIEDGDAHNHRNLPVLLAGAGNGAHLPGRHIHYDNDRPIADLYLWMAQAFGVDVETFGTDGQAPLEGLEG